MLIEVLVSALLVAAIAVGTYTGLAGANSASAHERANSQATVIAQQDEDRLRGLTVAHLNDLSGGVTYTVAENGMCVEEKSGAWYYWSSSETKWETGCEAVTGYKGTKYTGTVYTVTSSARGVTATTESLTCETATGAADNYLQTTSSVNWSSVGKHSPVSQSSLVAAPTEGTLRVKVKNSKAEPVAGATVTVSDVPTTGSTVTAEQTTSASGCVTFGDLPEGTAKVLASKAGWIEKTGKAPLEKTTSITTTSLAEVEFTIEDAGGIEAKFVNSAGTPVEGSTFVAFQTEMGSPAFDVGGKAETPATSAKLEELYPFTNDYKVYAGDCEANKPSFVGVIGAKEESVLVEPGVVKPVSVEEAPINVTVYEGTSGTPGNHPTTSIQTAMIIDTACSSTQHKVTLNSTGNIEQKYQPYAKELEFCVVALISSKYYKYKSPTTFANNLTAGTPNLPVYLKETPKTAPTNGYTDSTSKLTCP